MLEQVGHLEKIAEYLITRDGEEDYSTGVMDACEYITLVLAQEEKSNDHRFDTSDIRAPAILARFEKNLEKKDSPVSFFVEKPKEI